MTTDTLAYVISGLSLIISGFSIRESLKTSKILRTL